MKSARKILSMLLVIVLACSMMIPSFAASNGEITITRSEGVTGALTYNVYLMADLVSSSGDNYSYKVAAGWENFFTAQKIPFDTTSKLITYKTGITDVAEFAKAAVAYAKTNGIGATATINIAEGAASATATGLPLGYYCIDSQVGTVCALTTANTTATITDKNPPPSIEKTVMEDSNATFGQVNDDSIGKTVDFRIAVTKRNGALNYIVGDTMSAGLTFNPASVKVYYKTGEHAVESVLTSGTDYVLVEGTGFDAAPYNTYKLDKHGNARTFLVALKDAAIQDLADGTVIFIDYDATINENAVIGEAGNPNVATIIYGNGPFESTESKTITYVWDFDIYKYTVVGGAKTPLAGAKFKVVLKDTTTSPATEYFLNLAKDDAATSTAGYPVYKVSAAPNATGTEIETDATGKFRIIGLDSGEYWLRETAAPTGYNLLSYDIEVDIISDGNYATGNSLSFHIKNADANGFIEVENSTGVQLPATGSFGTFMFTLIGSVVVLVTGTLLVVKKRMGKVIYTK